MAVPYGRKGHGGSRYCRRQSEAGMNTATTTEEVKSIDSTFARMNRDLSTVDLASPEACAARHQRIVDWSLCAKARIRDYAEARALIRRNPIKSADDLLAFMQCIHGAIPQPILGTDLREAAERLLELCTDLDSTLKG